jgi:alpha-mannosidase
MEAISSVNKKLEKWLKQAEEILGSLEKAQQLSGRKFIQAELKRAEEIGFDDSSWEETKGNPGWSPAAGTFWQRRELIFPPYIEGISLKGSKVDSIIVAPSGIEIFLDGKSLTKYDYWADMRSHNLTIIERIEPSRKYLLALRFPKGDGLGGFGTKLRIQALDEMAFELSTVMQEINFVKEVLLKKEEDLEEDFLKVVEALNMEALKKRDWPKILSSLKKAEKPLTLFQSRAKEYKVYLVGHSHIDMNWLWPMEETIDVCLRDFDTVNKLMKEFPSLHFSQSQAAVYEIVRKKDPSLFNEVKERIKEKRWEATSSTWVEGDLNMAAGEALVRQLLYGKAYTKKILGANPKVCWEPDTFGHSVSYPQVLAKAGIKYYYFMRCGKKLPIFWWEAPDGSRVLAFNSIYNGEITAKNVVSIVTEIARDYAIKSSMYLFGVGDHGGGPTRRDILAKMELDKRPALPNLIFSSSEDFYDEALRERIDYPVVKDELNPIFEGCYTTHSDIKKANREGENLLLTAEALATLASLYGYSYPHSSLKEAWEKVCFNQFHDIFDGSAIHSSYEYSGKLGEEAKKTAQNIIEDSLTSLSSHIKTEGKNKKALPLIAFNQLGWLRDDLVAVEMPQEAFSSFHLIDEKDNLVPFQIEEKKLVFVARKVPAFGYKTYWMVEGEKTPLSEAKLSINKEGKMESADYLLQVEPSTGVITRLYDKKAQKEIFRPSSLMEGNPDTYSIDRASNLFRLFKETPHSMSSWVIGNIEKVVNLSNGCQIKIEEEGPVRIVLSILRFFSKSYIEQKIILYRDLERIDFVTKIDWQEKGSQKEGIPMLKVSFHLNFSSPEATFEIPFGHIKRPTLGEEMPALRWIDVSKADYGVSLINDSKYGHQVQGNSISLTLLRSPYEPDALPDLGVHHVGYAIYPHNGKWEKEKTIRKAAEFNQPLLTQWQKVQGGNLPSSFGLLNLEQSNLVVSGLKKTEDDKGIILRFYEVEGKKTTATLASNLPLASCIETNLLEEKERNDLSLIEEKVQIEVLPFEIKTLLLLR